RRRRRHFEAAYAFPTSSSLATRSWRRSFRNTCLGLRPKFAILQDHSPLANRARLCRTTGLLSYQARFPIPISASLGKFQGFAQAWQAFPKMCFGLSSVALPHHKIQRTQNRNRLAHHVVRQEPWQNAQVDEGRRADFQPVRRSSAFAVDVKAEFALRVFRAEINFTGRRVNTLRDEDELVDQLLHAREHFFLGREN